MAEEEIDAYMESAQSNLETARVLMEAERHADAVFHSALASEKATAALILQLGAKPSRRHRNSAILYRIVPRELRDRVEFKEILDELMRLEPHVIEARYPVRVEGTLKTPMERYGRKEATKAFKSATKIISTFKGYLK
ncbi:MAG: HEPN domain-containing protein [Candidatus Geothermarchaeales archaeon]